MSLVTNCYSILLFSHSISTKRNCSTTSFSAICTSH